MTKQQIDDVTVTQVLTSEYVLMIIYRFCLSNFVLPVIGDKVVL